MIEAVITKEARQKIQSARLRLVLVILIISAPRFPFCANVHPASYCGELAGSRFIPNDFAVSDYFQSGANKRRGGQFTAMWCRRGIGIASFEESGPPSL